MIRQIIITSAIIAVSHIVYAEVLTVETIKANLDNQSYLINNGKERISLEHIVNKDGTIETKVKRSYLPAVTDGKIIDKTRSYKLALNVKKFGKYLGKGVGYSSFAQMAIDILGAGVDYLLDPKNNTIQKINRQLRCQSGPPINLSADTPEELMDLIFAHPTFKRSNTNPKRDKFSYNPNNRVVSYNGYSYGGCQEQKKDVQVMSEEEFAKEVLKAAATQNNDKAKKVVIDYAKQEIINGDHDDVINDIVNDINSDTNTQPNLTDNPTQSKDTDNNPSANPQTNPKTDKPKPKDDGGGFELPPFCSWASKVCDFIDWVKEPPPKPEENKPIPKANLNDIHDLQELDRFKKRIDFEGQCPTGELSFSVKSVAYSYKIPYHHFCSLLEQLRPWLLAFAYLSTAFFVVSNL